MTCYGDASWLRSVLEQAMASFLRDLKPSILLDQAQNVSDLHAISTSSVFFNCPHAA